MASGVLGDTTVFSERSVGDAWLDFDSSKFLYPSGAWMTDCGSLSGESERVRGGSCVSILYTRSCAR